LGPGKPHITGHTRSSAGKMTAFQQAVRFEHAVLAIEVFPKRQRIAGVSTLTFTALSDISQAVLDLDTNLGITNVEVNGARVEKKRWSNPVGQLQVGLPNRVRRGEKVQIKVAYAGRPHVAVRAPWEGGIVWSKTPSGAPFIATAHQLQGCDLLWPCIDHPQAEPALVDLHITVPKGLSAPANGVLRRIRVHEDGRRTFDWRVKRPNTYALALNVAPYEVLRSRYRSRFGNIIPLEFWHLPEQADRARMLFAEFAPTLDFFETMIGPYPFGDEKVGVAETPHKGMEHQTMNAYGNRYARTPDGFDDLFQHEFAHEWFANQLTNASADDFWLHEGYASYMQPLYARWRGGEMAYLARMHEARSGIRNCFPIVSRKVRTIEQVYKPETGPSGDIYSKGAWVLHTLRHLIGDEVFFRATRRIVYGRADPRPGNFKPRFASTQEFIDVVNEEAQGDYRWFFDAYLYKAALPELISRTSEGRVLLQWRVPGGGRFPMPVEVDVSGTVQKVAMTDGSGSVALPAGARPMIDPQAKILRRSRDIEALQRWQFEEHKRKPKPVDSAPRAVCLNRGEGRPAIGSDTRRLQWPTVPPSLK
jgi:aminopeptidase N